jgi:hypothetical protein
MSARTRGLLIGFVAGAVTATAWPLLGAIAADITRPFGKALMKHGLLGAERLRAAIARTTEAVDDLLAEIRFEVDAELARHDRTHMGGNGSPATAQQRSPRSGSSNLS